MDRGLREIGFTQSIVLEYNKDSNINVYNRTDVFNPNLNVSLNTSLMLWIRLFYCF